MTTLTAKKLIAFFVDINDPDHTNQYPVYEFENGLILVSSETTSDWFFCSRSEIEGGFSDMYDHCEETGETVEFSKYVLALSLGQSTREFTYDEAIKKGWDLISSKKL